MDGEQPTIELRVLNSGRYLVLADGAVIDVVERRVGPGRAGYAQSKRINYH